MNSNSERLSARKWGVFNHYLYIYQGTPDTPQNAGVGALEWNDLVNKFDAERLAYNLHKMGAGYYFLTLMQGRKYMCSPNATYDKIAGTKPGEACSTRDLPMDIYHALKKYDIDLCLYFTGDGPYRDEPMASNFGFTEPREGLLNEPFVRKWASVLEEYTVRYGDKVKAWWMDGCDEGFMGYKPEWLDIYNEAIRKGNPEAAVCFNNGTLMGFKKYYAHEDLVAGERNCFNGFPWPNEKYNDGALAHILAPLGYYPGSNPWWDWCRPGLKHTREYMYEYIKGMNAFGGIVTVDMMVDALGDFDPEQLACMTWVSQKLAEDAKAQG